MEASTNLRRLYSEHTKKMLNEVRQESNIENNLERNPESPEVDSYFINTIMQTGTE
jgi:hypothetical protein